MELSKFIHLRVHSNYSLLEGAVKVSDMVDLCKEHNMPAIAITDSFNMFGGVEFSVYTSKDGVQPILGAQLWVKKKPKDIYDKDSEVLTQLVVLVQNRQGYQNIIKLISKGFLDMTEDSEKPSLYIEDLKDYSEGLIAFTGGVNGLVGKSLLAQKKDEAEKDLLILADIFPNRLYMEIMRHGIDKEMMTEPGFLELAYKHNIPLVATNEVFFKDRSFYEAHDALICIADKKYVSEDDRNKLTEEHYFKSPDEMIKLFADLPEAIENTVKIAKRCGFMIEKTKVMFPVYTADDMGDLSEYELMKKRAEDGLSEKLAKIDYGNPEEYKERLAYEIGIINQMGFCGYFLIVSDFIMYSKNNGIPVGPGRGSGAGSLVAWCLGITDLDPLRFGLLFERFLNPERVSMPDFDIDFCQEKREKTIQYVQDKYGFEKVAQIITYGKLQAKAVVRDAGRVLQVPFPVVDKFAKKIPAKNPDNPNKPVTLEVAVKLEPELDQMIKDERQVRKMYDISRKLEGLYRNASTHAAGVVIGPKNLDEILPLYKDIRSPTPVTQFDMKWVEDIGLIKFDFLGLKTLTVIDKAIKLIEKTHGTKIDIADIPLDCKEAYELLHRAQTAGVFQLESQGMRDVLRQLKPDTLEEITAVVALYRPGPMGNIPTFINRKFGKEEIESIHPKLDSLLGETYGIIVYQEQVMEIAKILAGYSLGGADLLRRAMGKKKKEEMDAQRKVFTEGCMKNAIDEAKATEIFDLMEKFALYGFNKSHAAAYALISYQTAYLKALYPVEFMAATMTLDINNTDKLGEFRQEIQKMGIEILPPDINKSEVEFSVENGKIRYALGAIKNVGSAAMQSVVDKRAEIGDIIDMNMFVNNYDTHLVNRKCLENMIKSGCFDSINTNRNSLFYSIDAIIETGNSANKSKNDNQISLFSAEETVSEIRLADVDDWPQIERLKFEQDALGFYLSSHPLDGMDRALKRLDATPIVDIDREVKMNGSGFYKIAGIISGVKSMMSKKGNRFYIIAITDKTETKEIFCFSDAFLKFQEILESGKSLLFILKGEYKHEEDVVRYNIIDIDDLETRKSALNTEFQISIAHKEAVMDIEKFLSKAHGGKNEVYISCPVFDKRANLKIGKFNVDKETSYRISLIDGVIDIQEG